MGRKPLPTTKAVNHMIEAWVWLDRARDKLREAWVTMDRELWEAEQELRRANGLIEGRRDE